ncbi:MAG: hypothetical protein M1831_001586 [Alyxoria varia]|nr:MAG: hypothetical protein M1831_001586 [Alyxoria varia]
MFTSGTIVAFASLLSCSVNLSVVEAKPHHQHHHGLAHEHLHQRRDVADAPRFDVAPSASHAVQAMAASAAAHDPDPIPVGKPPAIKPAEAKVKVDPAPPAAKKEYQAPAPKKEESAPETKKEEPAPKKKTPKKAKAPSVAHSSILGYATDKAFNAATYRDGGGGGCIGGKCVIGFSDSTTCAGEYVTPAGGKKGVTKSCKDSGPLGMSSFAHNSFSVLDCAEKLGKKSPAKSIHDFGDTGSGNSNFSKAVLGPVTPKEKKMGGDFAIWPNSNLVHVPTALKKNQLVGVYGAVNMNSHKSGKSGEGKPTDLYTTMATIDVPHSAADVPTGSTLKGKRIITKLWTPDQPQYGKFTLLSSHTIPGADKKNPYLYLFAVVHDTPGKGKSALKVARVPAEDIKNKEKYEFYCTVSKQWKSEIPKKSDTASNIFVWEDGKMDTGEIFWSKKHDSLVLVFQKFGAFYISTIKGKFVNPRSYSEPEKFFETEEKGLVYGGHAYPGWDQSGEKLLLSWSVDVNWIGMGIVEWA